MKRAVRVAPVAAIAQLSRRSAPCRPPSPERPLGSAPPGPSRLCESRLSAPREVAAARTLQTAPASSHPVRSSASNRENKCVEGARRSLGNRGSGFSMARWALLSQPWTPNHNSPTPRERARDTCGKSLRLCSLFSSHCLSADRRGPDHSGSALPTPSSLLLLPSLHLPHQRPFSVLPNPLLSLQQSPAPRTSPSHAPPPTPLSGWSSLSDARSPCLQSLHPPPTPFLSPRLRFPTPTTLAPHFSSSRPILRPSLAWVPSHDSPEIKILRGKVASRSRIQAPSSEEPRHPRAP